MAKPFTINEFRLALMDGAYAWPGGYPRYFIMDDGEALSFDAAQENEDLIVAAIAGDENGGWRVIAADINWEDDDLTCAHTGNKIECAYSQNEQE